MFCWIFPLYKQKGFFSKTKILLAVKPTLNVVIVYSRVGSSTVEQWPFKPLVMGSNPFRPILRRELCFKMILVIIIEGQTVVREVVAEVIRTLSWKSLPKLAMDKRLMHSV